MSRTPKPVKTPFETTTEVPETEDIRRFREFQPDTSMLSTALDAQFGRAEKQVRDQYGAYSGIPSHVARNRLADLSRGELAGQKSMALAEGNTQAQRLRMAQLESVAGMTRGQKQSGYNSQLPPSSGMGAAALGSGISAGASIGIAIA